MQNHILIQFFLRGFLILILISFLVPMFTSINSVPTGAFYIPFWCILIIVIDPKIIFSKALYLSIPFLILHIIYSAFDLYAVQTIISGDTMDKTAIAVFFSLSIFEYYKHSQDYKGLKIIITVILIACAFTGLTSILGLFQFPYAARDLAGGLSKKGQDELINFYMSLGIATYQFFFGLAILLPVFLYFSLKKRLKTTRKYFFILTIISFVSILFSQIASAFFIATFGILMIMILRKKSSFKKYTLVFIIGLVAIYIIPSTMGKSIRILSEVIDFEQIKIKLAEVANVVDPEQNGRSAENIEAYQERLNISINTFGKNPITGGGKAGGHHFWIDILANFGIIGIIPWIVLIYTVIRSTMRTLNPESKVLYLHGWLMFILIGLSKNILIETMFFYFTFILPTILFVYNRSSVTRIITTEIDNYKATQ